MHKYYLSQQTGWFFVRFKLYRINFTLKLSLLRVGWHYVHTHSHPVLAGVVPLIWALQLVDGLS